MRYRPHELLQNSSDTYWLGGIHVVHITFTMITLPNSYNEPSLACVYPLWLRERKLDSCFLFSFCLFVCFSENVETGQTAEPVGSRALKTVGKLGWSIAHPPSSNVTTLIIVRQLYLFFSPAHYVSKRLLRVWLDFAWCVYLRVHGKEEETRVYVYAKEQETVCLSEPASQLAAAHSCSPKRQVATIWSGSRCNGIVRLLPSPRESCTSSLPDCLNFNHFKSLPCFHPPHHSPLCTTDVLADCYQSSRC